MRKIYLQILKECFRDHVSYTRVDRHLTQAQISDLFSMDTRSYSYIEHGETCCGVLTFALFLIRCCDDPLQFLSELDAKFKAAEKSMEEVNPYAAV